MIGKLACVRGTALNLWLLNYMWAVSENGGWGCHEYNKCRRRGYMLSTAQLLQVFCLVFCLMSIESQAARYTATVLLTGLVPE